MKTSTYFRSWAAFCLSTVFTSTHAQNSSTNDTVAAPYFALFDTEAYDDGTGVDPSKNLNQPTVVAINVPEGDGRDDLFIHFSAPAEKHSWAGFGFGPGMSNALMFLVYRAENKTSGNNNNTAITVSPRLSTGHSLPRFTPDVNFTLLELSGFDDVHDRFVVNMQCFNCRKWKGGEIVTTADNKDMSPVFYALGPDTDLESDDQETPVRQHERFSEVMGLYLVPGTAGIPIVDGDPSEPRQIAGRNGTGFANGEGSGQIGTRWSLALHAFFMCFAFSLVFPGGFLLLRLFNKVWLHWIPQSAGVLCVLGGLGAGIRASVKGNLGFTHPHQIFGFVIVFLTLGTWTLGFVGHRIYKKTQMPSALMKVHRVAGPLCIALGIANAMVGFAWLGLTRTIATYAIFNVFVAVVIGSLLFWKRKRDLRKGAVNSHAASNFREGNEAGFGHGPAVYYGGGHPSAQQGVQMQTFHPSK